MCTVTCARGRARLRAAGDRADSGRRSNAADAAAELSLSAVQCLILLSMRTDSAVLITFALEMVYWVVVVEGRAGIQMKLLNTEKKDLKNYMELHG